MVSRGHGRPRRAQAGGINRQGPGVSAAIDQLFQLDLDARQLVRARVERHAIPCPLTPGQTLCAAKPAHRAGLEGRAVLRPTATTFAMA